MEALELHTVAPTVHQEDNTTCIYVAEYKTVTPKVKIMDIPVCFLQEQFENGIFVTEYEGKICAPNHAQVKLPVGLLNIWLGSYYIQPVIHKIMN